MTPAELASRVLTLRNNYKFYAVFQENEEFTVRSGSEELGTIVKPPPTGEKIAIAGHVWLVNEVDYKRHLVYCDMIKYDEYLPEILVQKGFAYGVLDIEEMKTEMLKLCNNQLK